MPNTLTTIFTSTPSTEPVESAHPNTGVYVLGTQLANGTWQVIHTLVTKTSTPPTMTGRQKNYPTVVASVVATGGPNNGNVFNNILATPTGTSAVASSATAINATVSSNANATAYRLLSATTAGGTYGQLYQGAAASFAHTGLAAGTTYYYEWQYVGGGYYDDSALSGVFSGITTAISKTGYFFASYGDSRVAYPGDVGLVDQSSVLALVQKRFTDAGYSDITYLRYGLPGFRAAQSMVPVASADYPSYHATQYMANYPDGVAPLDNFISQLPADKNVIVQVGFLANGGEVVDTKAVCDKLKASGKVDFLLVTPVLNRLDPTYNPGGIPNRATKNAALVSSVGVWSNGISHTENFPQIYADAAPNDGVYFWSPDSISSLSKVHMTTAGNHLQAEADAQEFARLSGKTLPAVSTTPDLTSIAQLEQDNPLLSNAYSPGSAWTNYSPNVQYSRGTGAASNDANALVRFTANCYGFRVRTPQEEAAGAVQMVVTNAAGTVLDTLTGTQYIAQPPSNAGPLTTIVQKVYATAAVRTLTFGRAPGVTGTTLLFDVLEFCDNAGNWPGPAPSAPYVPWQEIITSGNVSITATEVDKVGGVDGAWDTAVKGLGFKITTGVGEKLRVQIPSASNPFVIGGSLVFGVSETLPTISDFAGIHYAGYLAATNSGAFVSGGQFDSFSGGTSGDVYFVVTDAAIELYQGSTLKHNFNVVPTVGATYYFTACLFNRATKLLNWNYTAAQLA